MTEVELLLAVMFAQFMLFIIRILNSMELKVKLLMELELHNKGAKHITYNWSVGRILRHVEVK